MLNWIILLASLMAPGMSLAASTDSGKAASPAASRNQATPHEMHASTAEMHQAMRDVPMTGDPDQDFVRMMIPHHQGAIDMARAYLKSGKNPEIRAMAEKIIRDQEKEIKDFKAWLTKNPARTH